MSHPYRYRTALARALAISLLLHVLASPAFVVSSSLSRSGDLASPAASETIVFAHVTPLTLDARRRHRAFAGSAAPAPRALRSAPRIVRPDAALPTERNVVKSLARRPVARPTALAATTTAAAAAARAARTRGLALALATAAPERRAAPEEPTRAASVDATPTATPMATPTGTPAPAPTASGLAVAGRVAARDGDVPLGGWGQTFARPLVADERALDELRARYPGTRAIRIEVDDAGRAVRVVLPENLAPDVRATLEHDLMALSFVPAECNGLRCSGILQISL